MAGLSKEIVNLSVQSAFRELTFNVTPCKCANLFALPREEGERTISGAECSQTWLCQVTKSALPTSVSPSPLSTWLARSSVNNKPRNVRCGATFILCRKLRRSQGRWVSSGRETSASEMVPSRWSRGSAKGSRITKLLSPNLKFMPLRPALPSFQSSHITVQMQPRSSSRGARRRPAFISRYGIAL